MKKKIIIICVAIITVAGGTAGITVAVTNSQNSDETENLVNEAVSSALEEAASETESEEFSKQNTDEESTKETAAKQKKPAANSETTTSQTTYPQVVCDTDENVMQRSDNGENNSQSEYKKPEDKTPKTITMPWGEVVEVNDENKCIVKSQVHDGDYVYWTLDILTEDGDMYCVDEVGRIFILYDDGNRDYIT